MLVMKAQMPKFCKWPHEGLRKMKKLWPIASNVFSYIFNPLLHGQNQRYKTKKHHYLSASDLPHSSINSGFFKLTAFLYFRKWYWHGISLMFNFQTPKTNNMDNKQVESKTE